MKAKAFAPVNVALIKYWGKGDEVLKLPVNSSLSVNLTNLGTETEVEWREDLAEDEVEIDGQKVDEKAKDKVVKHLDLVRGLAKMNLRAKVISKNMMPMGAGLSSSASGFAALSLAASKAAGTKLTEKDLSRLARKGSGSACRSIPDGWVEWEKGDSDESSYAKSVYGAEHWDIRILTVILSQEEKMVSSTDGQTVAHTSEFYETRIKNIDGKLMEIKKAIGEKIFSRMGEVVEEECLSMHSVMLTSTPNLIYWLPETIRVMQAVQQMREEGLECYFTINTGQNVFVLCEQENEEGVVKKLEEIEGVLEVRRDKIGNGARLLE